MSPAVYPLAGAGLTVASSIAFGTILLRGLGIRFHRVEQQAFAFITGSAALSMVVLALSAIHLARKGVRTDRVTDEIVAADPADCHGAPYFFSVEKVPNDPFEES